MKDMDENDVFGIDEWLAGNGLCALSGEPMREKRTLGWTLDRGNFCGWYLCFPIDEKLDLSLRAASVSLSLCKGYGFAGTLPAADPAAADAVAGEIHEGGRQRIWCRCYSRPSEDPGFYFSFFFPKV